MSHTNANTDKMIQAGILAWLIPGAGHYLLGHRALAVVFWAAITFAYLGGLVIGGVKNSVNPYTNKWLFLAEMGAGGYTTAAYGLNLAVGEIKPQDIATRELRDKIPPELYVKYVSYYPATDLAQIYLATAGLLNVLAVLDRTDSRPDRRPADLLPRTHRRVAQRRQVICCSATSISRSCTPGRGPSPT